MKRKVTTEDKVVLLLSLVPYLLANGATPVIELAERFSVPAEEVRKIASFLGTAGIPGETFTYQDQDMFDINWTALEEDDVLELVNAIVVDDTPKFSGVETAALLAGLQLLRDVLPVDLQKTAAGLQAKLASSTQNFNVSVTQDDTIMVPNSIDQISKAIIDLERLSIEYVALNGNLTTRGVDPLNLKQLGDYWYLEAYCNLRKGKRIFRVEGITSLKTTGVTYPSNRKLLIEDGFNIESDRSVIVAVHDSAMHQVESWAPEILGVHRDGILKVRVLLAHEANVLKLVLSAPGRIEVLEPPALRDFVSSWLSDTIALFR